MTEFYMDKYSGWEFTTNNKIELPGDSTFLNEWVSDNNFKSYKQLQDTILDKEIYINYVCEIEERPEKENYY